MQNDADNGNSITDEVFNSIKNGNDEMLLSGLSHDSYESTRFAAVFWDLVWPKLEGMGWQIRVRELQS